jgi:hypothetical protein
MLSTNDDYNNDNTARLNLLPFLNQVLVLLKFKQLRQVMINANKLLTVIIYDL